MEFILNLTLASIEQVWLSLQHNWMYLGLSVVVAVVLKLYVNAAQVSALLNRYRRAGVVAATAAAVGTPLCSCGTTAVILGMMASKMPWAPIVAFMVASPLTSPEGLFYTAGLFGWGFAVAFFIASIVLGLGGGWLAALLERRGWLANQLRFTEPASGVRACTTRTQALVPARVYSLDVARITVSDSKTACGCAGEAPSLPTTGCGCGSNPTAPGHRRTAQELAAPKSRVTLATFLTELYRSGKQLLIMFLGFAFVGYFLNGLIPAEWVGAVFGSGNVYNIPVAATLGLPLYINSEASLPLIRALLDNGMSQGAALAFLISGSGTSIGAITGALTIARGRVVALVVGVLWVGAILTGFAFNLALAIGLVQ